MSDEAEGRPLVVKLAVWVAYAPLTLLLSAFLAIMMVGEWMRIGWWRLRRLPGKADQERPPRVWTAPVQYRKPGW